MFENLVEILKKNPRKIVYTEGTDARILESAARLKADGYQVISGPRTTGDGYYESCVLGIEGNQIEITV